MPHLFSGRQAPSCSTAEEGSALGVPFLPEQRAAFFQASCPGCPAGDTQLRMAWCQSCHDAM